jgi:biotin carboxyl carrier protein
MARLDTPGAIARTGVKYRAVIGGRRFEIEVDHERLARVNGQPLYVDLEQVGGLPVYSLALDDKGYVVFVERGEREYLVEVQGQIYAVEVQKQRPQLAARQVECANDGSDCLAVTAPLAGNLVSLPVSAGDRVEAGQPVAIVESMKMQMELRTPEPGVVDVVHGPPGRNVEQEEELVIIRAG